MTRGDRDQGVRRPATLLGAAVIGAALAAAACSTSPTSSTGASGAPASAAGSPISSGAVASDVVAGPVEIGPGPFVLLQAGIGLDGLSSYRATLRRAFEGTTASGPQAWTSTIDLAHRRDPSATSVSVAVDGTGAPDEPGRLTDIAGVLYTVAGEGPCSAGVAAASTDLRGLADPASRLAGVVGGEPAGTEAVNGVNADHVRFDERAVGLAGIAAATGELWVAADGGHLLKYVLRVDAGPAYFGEGTTGALTTTYELHDIDRTVTIDIPAGCPQGRLGVPAMRDAVNVIDQPGTLVFETPSAIGEVMTFYAGQAGALGWSQIGAPMTNDQLGVLELTSEGRTITVVAQAAGGVTRVFVLDEG